jgi:hypothetical protein
MLEVLREYDKRHLGLLSEHDFARALSNAGLSHFYDKLIHIARLCVATQH